MKKIMIISYYDLKDFFDCIKKNFVDKYKYEICNYPLFQYAYDVNDKLENYLDHFIKYIKTEKPDIILWWFIDVSPDIFKSIKHKFQEIYFIMFNGDDPLNVEQTLFEKASHFDLVMTTCEGTIRKYEKYSGVKQCIFNPLSYDPKYFYPMTNSEIENMGENADKFKCDISFYNYALYSEHYSKQYVLASKFVDFIEVYCQQKNKTFKVYGPPFLKERYSAAYQYDLPYIEKNYVYNLSKINICLHASCADNQYINEFVTQILGSGGLLLIDKVKNLDKIFEHNKDCIYFDEDFRILEKQLDYILDDANSAEMDEIRRHGHETSKKFTWEQWVDNTHRSICKDLFDPVFYKNLYNLELEQMELWDYWLTTGINKGEICFKFNVPTNFRYKAYNKNYKLGDEYNDVNKSWLHYWMVTKDDDFLGDENTEGILLDEKKVKTNMEQIYNIMGTLSKVYDYNSTHLGLQELRKLCRSNPRLDIGECVETYFRTCKL